MTKTGVFLLILVSFAGALNIETTHQQAVPFGQVTLKGANGAYLERCRDCTRTKYTTLDAASVDIKEHTTSGIWTIERWQDPYSSTSNLITLRADSGFYLATCVDCSPYKDAALVVGTYPSQSIAAWTPELQSNGKWALKGFNGKYLSVCSDCVPDSNKSFAFVLTTSPSSSMAQWTIEQLGSFPTGKISLYADTYPNRLSICDCDGTKLTWSATLHITDPNSKDATWTSQKVGNQIALKGANGKYLNMCFNCYYFQISLHYDSAFVMADTPTKYALWTPERVNGKWALRGDNGKYLARCRNCVTGGDYPDTIFVETQNSSDPKAQWTVQIRK